MKRNDTRMVVASIAVAALVAACSGGDDIAHGDHEEGSSPAAMSSHIHGLAEVGGSLLVATHFGLFAVSADGEARQVSEDDHDFMGFTVADDGVLLASGHPNSRDDLPPNLGLLESADGGVTWEPVSLLGDVDFHAMDAKGDAVYGFNSVGGELMSSRDRSVWTEFHHGIALADLTIRPDDDAMIVITTEEGPRVSADAAESFELIDGAPLLMLVDWPRVDEFYGIGPEGGVYFSDDGGVVWQDRGTLGGRPQAMTVADDGVLYAATEAAILRSDDGGESFTIVVELT